MNGIFKLRDTNSRKIKTKPGYSKTQSSHVWNKKPKELRSENMECLSLPYKTSDNLNSFKTIIKCWDGKHCNCRVCEHATSRQDSDKT